MSACWPLVSVGVLQRDCVTLHYSTSNSDALSSVSRACAQNTQNYIRPQAAVDKISYISRLSIQNMFAAIQDFQKCYLYFVVCYNYEWCLLAVNAAINVFRQTVCNLCILVLLQTSSYCNCNITCSLKSNQSVGFTIWRFLIFRVFHNKRTIRLPRKSLGKFWTHLSRASHSCKLRIFCFPRWSFPLSIYRPPDFNLKWVYLQVSTLGLYFQQGHGN